MNTYQVNHTILGAGKRFKADDSPLTADNLKGIDIDEMIEMGALTELDGESVQDAPPADLTDRIKAAINGLTHEGFTKGKDPKPSVEAIIAADATLEGHVKAKLRDTVWAALVAEGVTAPKAPTPGDQNS